MVGRAVLKSGRLTKPGESGGIGKVPILRGLLAVGWAPVPTRKRACRICAVEAVRK